MMLPKQPVELHKIVCPSFNFKYHTEQEVLHDMNSLIEESNFYPYSWQDGSPILQGTFMFFTLH
jgi:hypothetical protein